MKNLLYYILFLAFFEALQAQDLLSYMVELRTDLPTEVQDKFSRKVKQDLLKLQKRKEKIKDSKRFIKYTFNFLHQNYLKTYHKTASFSETIAKGKYNCVSGTALIGYFLEQNGYQCVYYETPKHAFLVVQIAPNDRVLVESTAFFSGGLIDNEEQIGIELTNYQPVVQIQAIHLVGLLCYNEGVLAYENQDYLSALRFGNQAYYFYASPRHKALCLLAKQNLENQKFYSKIE